MTGIPRSGTSYFVACLNEFENCIAINEPEDIFQRLDDATGPWGMSLYYRHLREVIREGRPITNKVSNGRLIEDTAVIDQQGDYVPDILGPHFLLGTKNTLAYLARLPYLAMALPGAVFVACVRHPLATIASWKTTFPHLQDIDVRTLPKGILGDPLLRPAANERLAEIAATRTPELRRALFWRHLAMQLLEERALFATIVAYEKFVTDPEGQFQLLFAHVPESVPFRLRRPLSKSSARTQRLSCLTRRDVEAVRSVCTESAACFGYDIDHPLPGAPACR